MQESDVTDEVIEKELNTIVTVPFQCCKFIDNMM